MFLYLSYGNLKTSDDVDKFKQMLHDHEGLVWTSAFSVGGFYQDTINAIQKVNGSNPKLQFIFENNDHFLAVQAFWKRYGVKKMLSSGFYFVSSALELCKKVNAFGFWPFMVTPDRRRAIANHYYNIVPRKGRHDMSDEFKLLVAMHYYGLLHLHVGNCTANTKEARIRKFWKTREPFLHYGTFKLV